MRIVEVSASAGHRLRKLARGGLSVANIGSRRYCPVCERGARHFLAEGPRPEARCPHCESLEAGRAAWLFLKERSGLLAARGNRVLHVSPEPLLVARLRRAIGPGYVTAAPAQAIEGASPSAHPRADVTLDLCDNPFRNEWFDVVVASGMLEHARDQRKALRELRRVLVPGGRALLSVPGDPAGIARELEGALLAVELFHPRDLCPAELAEAMALGEATLAWCRRPA